MRSTHKLVTLDSRWAGIWTAMRPVVIKIVNWSRFGLVEASHSCRQSLKLGTATWDVGRGLDPVHKALLVVFDALTSELTLRVAAVGVSHVDFLACRHQILEIAGLLLFLRLLLGLSLGHLGVEADVCLLLPLLPGVLLSFLGDGLVVFVLVDALVLDIIVCRGVFHAFLD